MKIMILMGQRKERYEGEYAPEALECINEFGHDENPEFMRDKLREYQNTGEFDSLSVVAVEINGRQVLDILYPARKAIPGTVSAEA